LLLNLILTLRFYVLINKLQHSPFHLIVALKLTFLSKGTFQMQLVQSTYISITCYSSNLSIYLSHIPFPIYLVHLTWQLRLESYHLIIFLLLNSSAIEPSFPVVDYQLDPLWSIFINHESFGIIFQHFGYFISTSSW